MTEGWDSINAIGSGAEKVPDPNAPADTEIVDKLFVDALNNPAGMRLIAFWKKHYLDQPVCVPGAGAEVGFHREGQNDVIRDAIRRLIRGTTPKT